MCVRDLSKKRSVPIQDYTTITDNYMGSVFP